MSHATHNPTADLYAAEFSDPYTLYPGERRGLLAGARWRRFVVLGDSLAEGIGQPVAGYVDSPWADRVAAALGDAQPDLEYTNLGASHLTADQVGRTQLGAALGAQPDLIAIVAGGNDLFATEVDPIAVAASIEQTIAALQATGATLVMFTLMDIARAIEVPRGSLITQRITELNAALRMVALRRGVALVDTAERPFAADASIYSDDLLHPNMRGHAAIASATIETLGELVRFDEGEL